jgi:hypothetical protein
MTIEATTPTPTTETTATTVSTPKTSTTTTTGSTTRAATRPWESRRIWASVLGIILVAVLFFFGQEEIAISTAGLVAAYVLSRGVGKIGLGLFLVVTLGGCGLQRAQVAVQSSLTGLAEGIDAADRALVAEIPEQRDAAIAGARTRCAVTLCQDPLVYYDEAMAPLDRAADGLEVAVEALHVAQAAQDAWVASGDLPDTDPLCEALSEGLGTVPDLLDEAGVDVPAGLSGLSGVLDMICGVVARWVR